MNNKLTKDQFISISIMLFGLFFGAGNLIFPPLLGNQAGSNMWISLLSFSVTAVIFPVLGVIVVSKTNGLSNLANRVGKTFSIIFTTVIYLSIGPGLGIPRAGSVPFEMAVAPYLSSDMNVSVARLIYTGIFFYLAYLISIKPNKLVKRMGKYLTPSLLILILFMFIGVLSLDQNVAQPQAEYATTPVVKGFLEGYNTLDAMAGLNFGFVISLAIRRFKVTDDKQVINYSLKAGLLAGTLLFVVYAMLSYVGMTTSNLFVGAENGAIILTETVKLVFGNFGAVLLAAIFTLACLTTCVGLITSGSEYFLTLFHEIISYKQWVIIWTGFSFVVANFGLNTILKFSVPLLSAIYPVSLLLIVMGITHDWFQYSKLAYVASATVAVVMPLLELLSGLVTSMSPMMQWMERLPLSEYGLSWLVPTLIVLFLSTLLGKMLTNRQQDVVLQGEV